MSARGEGVIQAGDREVQVLFTNRALAEAEDAMGKGIIGVADGFSSGQTGIRDVAYLLRAGMEAARREARDGRRPITMVDAYAVLDDAGFSAVTMVVMTAVADVLGYSANGENEEAVDPNG